MKNKELKLGYSFPSDLCLTLFSISRLKYLHEWLRMRLFSRNRSSWLEYQVFWVKTYHRVGTSRTKALKNVLYLLQECQSLIEENRRLLNLTTDNNGLSSQTVRSNVEAVILQSKVETLQWQLKQVGTSQVVLNWFQSWLMNILPIL